jgi:15,16-dihydrobiliverdin:ferredoxin oxidoreductase
MKLSIILFVQASYDVSCFINFPTLTFRRSPSGKKYDFIDTSTSRASEQYQNKKQSSSLKMTTTVNSTATGVTYPEKLFSTADPNQKRTNKKIPFSHYYYDDCTSEAEAIHGMPWKSSIGSYTPVKTSGGLQTIPKDMLLFMPFWEWQLSFMKSTLTNLKSVPCSDSDVDFSYMENSQRKARVVNACYESKEYRKIRMTYYDAGDKTQVFNSLWYPDNSYDAPLLGIDLLAFNRKKFLFVVDFQPLPDNHEKSNIDYTHFIKHIYEDMSPSLKGKMSERFYDENQFFSKYLLFGRLENDDEELIYSDLWEAFRKYVQSHVDMIQRHVAPNNRSINHVREGQRQYDAYSAVRDPAHALFKNMFGEQWADAYVYDFLFDMSGGPEKE